MLNHFRYRFDPKWRDDMSDEQKFQYHMRIIKAWAGDTNWIERPWRLDNFPLNGRAGAPLIMISSPKNLKDELDYHEYQSSSSWHVKDEIEIATKNQARDDPRDETNRQMRYIL
jgi:hypothetical protein